MFSITIPTTHRIAIRKLIRSQAGYEAFRLANGAFKTRAITHSQTMLAIEAFGLEQAVLDMLSIAAPIDNEPEPDDMAETETETETETDTPDATNMADTVLNPLRPFLSPVLLGQVESALAPIVSLALKPAIVTEVERVVRVAVDAETGQSVALPETFREARIVGGTTLGKLFGFGTRGRCANYPVSLWDATDSVPPRNPHYVPEPNMIAQFITRAERGRAVWFAGASGTGKSTTPEVYASLTQRPFVGISFQRAVDPLDLIGSMGLDGKGGEKWRDGLLTRSIRRPGTVILFDEITAAPPGILMILQSLLSSRYMTLPTGERVQAAEGVVFCAADNTFGYGDETGVYAGTMSMNAALVDRMAVMIPVGYLPADLETQALVNHTGAPKAACRRVVDFVNSARKLSGFETWPLSLRRMIAFVEMLQDSFPIDESLNLVFLTRLPSAEREALRTHFRTVFDVSAMQAEMAGNPVPAAPSSDPEQQAARNAFDAVDSAG